MFCYSNVEEGKNDEEMEMPGCFESTKEASLLTSLGAFGQSWDVYSDIGLAVQFANGEFIIVIYNSDLRCGVLRTVIKSRFFQNNW